MLNKILLLEHDEDDVYITSTIFQELGIDVQLQVVSTSDELFTLLNDAVKRQIALPSIILLNYNAIPVGAVEIVKALKTNPLFKAIPLVVGCGVVNDKIVAACYAEGVSTFIKKSDNTAGMRKSVTNFINYWREAVLLPG